VVLNKLDDIYKSEIFDESIKQMEKVSKLKYEKNEKSMRIIVDHIRTATFILGDDKKIIPSNSEQGYILRRIIRRAIRHGKKLGIDKSFISGISKTFISNYPEYPELKKNEKYIFEELAKEESRFSQTLEQGLNKFNKLAKNKSISGKEAFLLFQSFGFPIEMTEELAKENKIKVDTKEFDKEFAKHQELSRTAAKGKFSSGLADNSEQTTRLHTATHLLNEALREILDKNITQKGSNITPERLRFDFNFDRKLTDEEKKKIEDFVNEKIKESLEVTREEMSLKEAIDSGAQGEFGTKYPNRVSVYTIKDKSKKGWFSKEICTGPHVKNTKEIGHFKIKKEGSSSAGVRRIKAVVK